MTSSDTFADVMAKLARADVAGWRGLPDGLDWRAHIDAGDAPAGAALGDASEPADMIHVADATTGRSARAWLRDDSVILIDVPMAPDVAGPAVPNALGMPDRRLDVIYGLLPIPQGEWVYAARGLALVVHVGRIRHAIGFAPSNPDDYARRLRVPLAVTRRPLASRHQEDDL